MLYNNIFFLLIINVSSTTYYIGPTGDSNAMDQAGYGIIREEPFKTLRYAVKEAQPGDEFILLNGEYTKRRFRKW